MERRRAHAYTSFGPVRLNQILELLVPIKNIVKLHLLLVSIHGIAKII